jgi:UDP-GlcNAc:undecaprenyl-phosphate GlcNAc-1-phosphate transferase
MVHFFLSALTGFFVSLLMLPQIIKYANRKNLFVQLNQRKIHQRITPSMGGIAIFGGLVAAALANSGPHYQIIVSILLVLLIPFSIGFLDDRFHLRPSRKIVGQLVAATCVFFVLGIKITSMYGIFDTKELPEWLSYFITVLTIVLLTNSFNLIDGIDGLAGTFSLLAFLFFGIWFSLLGISVYAIVSFALIGSVAAFLIKNWQPSKIFMGDTGSLVLGMSLAMLAIEFLNENQHLPTSSSLKFNSGVGTALCVLIVPIVDTIRVVIIRVSRGISPLTADKRHIHHALVRIGKSHRFAVVLIFFVHIFFLANALILKRFDDSYVIGSVTLFSWLLCLMLDKVVSRRALLNKSRNSLISFKRNDPVMKL